MCNAAASRLVKVGCGQNGCSHQETRTLGTMTWDILEMADWLQAEAVTQVAVESTDALLFTWNHAHEIMETELAFREGGGKRIVYVPEVAMLD